MAITAQAAIRELGYQLDDCFLATASGTGLATTIVASGLRKFFPTDGRADQWTPWVYAISGTAANIVAAQTEQRARQWSADSATITLYTPGYPSATATSDTFELHFKTRRARKLGAINYAVRQLGLYCWREFKDESLTTASKTFRYTLPSSQNWRAVKKVEIQVNTDSTYTGYPFSDASEYLWEPVKTTNSTTGAETWELQFTRQPPYPYTLRVWGEGYYPDLSLDADVLAISGEWGNRALSWIYEWGKWMLSEEISKKLPEADAQKWKTASYSSLKKVLDDILRDAPGKSNTRVVVPIVTDPAGGTDIDYFGSGNTPS